jgi:hypothetical protein
MNAELGEWTAEGHVVALADCCAQIEGVARALEPMGHAPPGCAEWIRWLRETLLERSGLDVKH